MPLNELSENDIDLFKGEFVVNGILYEYIKDDLIDAQIKKLNDNNELFYVVGCVASAKNIIKRIGRLYTLTTNPEQVMKN